MRRPLLQFVLACFGVLLLAGSAAFVLTRGFDAIAAAAVVVGLLLLVPAFFDPRSADEDLDRLTEELRRYRAATFGCFGISLLICALVTSSRSMSSALQNRFASLGAAFWVVGMILMFFVVHYGTRRATAEARDDD